MTPLRDALAAFEREKRLPCALAAVAADTSGETLDAVGRHADERGMRVVYCQLGLFGYDSLGAKRWTCPPASVPPDLEAGVRAACVDGRLPCAAAWRLADARGLPRPVLGAVAEALGVRVSRCQLGCFE